MGTTTGASSLTSMEGRRFPTTIGAHVPPGAAEVEVGDRGGSGWGPRRGDGVGVRSFTDLSFGEGEGEGVVVEIPSYTGTWGGGGGGGGGLLYLRGVGGGTHLFRANRLSMRVLRAARAAATRASSSNGLSQSSNPNASAEMLMRKRVSMGVLGLIYINKKK